MTTLSPLILASTSPRRHELMKILGIKFKIVAPDYEEDMTLPMPPKKLVAFLALGKAKSIFAKNPNCVVIGSDTVVVARGKVLGKPKNPTDARRMLKLESGQKVFIHSAVVVLAPGKKPWKLVSSSIVYFKKLSQKEINSYVKLGDARDYAGGFAMQGRASVFIKKSDGNIQSILGMPTFELAQALTKLGFKLWSEK